MSFFLLDSSTSWQLYFQDAATPVMEGIINLSKDNMMSNVYDIIDRVDVKEV